MRIITTTLCVSLLLCACGSDDLEQKVGTLIFTANGEDFVRQGFVSEDGWSISFDSVEVNVEGPTAYQVVESQSKALRTAKDAAQQTTRHGGHPHENVPEGSAHVALTGEYLLQLQQDVHEAGRIEDAPIGNYNRMAFNVKQTASGESIVLTGSASKDAQAVDFTIRFGEEMSYYDCGPNEFAGVLAEGGQARAEMTFHFDHIFGDIQEGDPDPEDENTVNYVAVGFQPFADLADLQGALDTDQEQLGLQMSGAVFHQLIDAVRTLGHSGEGHCHLD